ncbi:MAG: glycosyltransferase family 1 protein, partial [Nitrospirae bacterium]|nr:glycosyltransferase family 1 protein [Nitrospirota bacterium]
IDRKYDLGLIGRCHNNDKDISAWKLKLHLKVFEEGNLGIVRRSVGADNYLDRYSTLVLNLNQCLTSWNSPVCPKGMEKGSYSTPLRFIEAPSCGAVMVCPFDYPELNEYYYPKKAYINCDSDLSKAIKQIKELRKNTEAFLELQNIAYRYVMANHQTKNRVDFILDLINGNTDTDVRNYYKMPLNE